MFFFFGGGSADFIFMGAGIFLNFTAYEYVKKFVSTRGLLKCTDTLFTNA